jgi:hypothetical protein
VIASPPPKAIRRDSHCVPKRRIGLRRSVAFLKRDSFCSGIASGDSGGIGGASV